jgi:type II secretory pathway component GspD/PulD (secretin)
MKKKIIYLLVLNLVLLLPGEFAPNGWAQEIGDDGGVSESMDLLDLKNMDILDVAKLISQKSGVNIVVGKNVKGRVTVYLKEISMEEALQIIVDAYGWAYVNENNIIKIMTAKEYEERYGYKFGRKLETKIYKMSFVNPKDLVDVLSQLKSQDGKIIADEKSGAIIIIDRPAKILDMEDVLKRLDVAIASRVFSLSYADVEEVSRSIEEVITMGVGSVKFDVRSSKVIVSDTEHNLSKIAQIIRAFDQPHEEVLIEAKIVQITLNDEHRLGVDWEGIVSDFHSLTFKNNFDVLGATDKRGELSFGTLADDDYTFLIQALDIIGETNILSSPRITTISNQEAKILVGSTEPYVTTTTTTPASGPTTTAESVNFIEVGVKLYVTPTIHDDGFITMKIKPEVSSVVRNVTTSNNNNIPVVETSEAETTVMVKDNVTIVIGGLIKEDSISTTRRVPLLGSIPGVGRLFRNESTDDTKTEIVIFLTPKIITGDVQEDEMY